MNLHSLLQITLARVSRENRAHVLLMAVAGLILCIAIALPIYGFWQERIVIPNKVVSTVGEREFKLGYLLKLVRAERMAAFLRGDRSFDVSYVPFTLLDNLEGLEVLIQATQPLGITASLDEMDAALQEYILGPVDPVAEPTDEQFTQIYQAYLEQLDLSDGDVREMIRGTVLQAKVISYLSQNLPKEQEQVHVYSIVSEDANQSQAFLEQLDQGKHFLEIYTNADLTETEISSESPLQDEDAREPLAVDLGWWPRGVFLDVEEIVFNLEPGAHSKLVEGTTIYYVADRETDRLVDDGIFRVLQAFAYEAWIAEQRSVHRIERCFTPPYRAYENTACAWQYDWLMEQIS